MTNLERIEKLIDAGYTKAEIDALMFDQTPPSQSGDNKGVDNNESKSNETKPTEANTETASTVANNTQTVNDQVSNVALLTAINNLTKTIQQNNRNNDTSDGNVASTESASSILSKALK